MSYTNKVRVALTFFVALALAAACLVIPSHDAGAATQKLHIHHGWDLSDPSMIAAHKATIESRPIDGVTVILRGLSDNTMGGTQSHTQTEYATALSKMPVMTKVVHNFVIVRMLHTFNFNDDAAWTRYVANFKALAAATKAHGQFDGIFIDVEYYSSESPYPWAYPSGATQTTKDSLNAAANKRGQQVESAIGSVWPGAGVLSTYGPWVGDSKTYPSTGGNYASFGWNDISWRNNLMGAFSGGLAAGAASGTTTYLDGGELYQAHTATEYATAYKWQKTGLAASGSKMVTNPTTYSAHTSVTYGVYDKDMRVSNWPVANATQWQTWMTNSLKTADRYVWSYSEKYDWLGSGHPATPVPADILTATKNALTAANSGVTVTPTTAAPSPTATVSPKPTATSTAPACP